MMKKSKFQHSDIESIFSFPLKTIISTLLALRSVSSVPVIKIYYSLHV
jgi:hypothetical protein